MGRATRVGIGPVAGSAATREFDFLSCTGGVSQGMDVSPGIRGTRSYFANQVTPGVKVVSRQLTLHARPDDLDFLLPYILGAASSGTTFALAETVPSLILAVDQVAQVVKDIGCVIASGRFSGGSNQKLQLVLAIEALDETVGATGTFPDIADTLSLLQPYYFQQGTLKLATVVREFDNFELLVNNMPITDRFNNSVIRTEIPLGDRQVTFACDCPFTTDELDIYNAGVEGMAAELKFTNGNRFLTFTMPCLKKPLAGVDIGAKNQELKQRPPFQAFATQAADGTVTPELTVTNKSADTA
jgi:hypothetical protein